jgi:sialate O-acetylesterase
MDSFLTGGDHPAGHHHGIDFAREVDLVGVSGDEVPMKQKLAVMAHRYDVALGWGWPWPAAEPAPPQLNVTAATHLQQLLGDDVAVRNFSVSGTTLLARGHNPYTQRQALSDCLAFQPHVVIINLGFNDANDWNWRLRRNEFCGNYLDLIDRFADLPTKPEIYVCIPTVPQMDAPHAAEVQQLRREIGGVDSSINAVAALRAVSVVDLEYALTAHDYSPDMCHPNESGVKHIAIAMLSAVKSKSEYLNPEE